MNFGQVGKQKGIKKYVCRPKPNWPLSVTCSRFRLCLFTFSPFLFFFQNCTIEGGMSGKSLMSGRFSNQYSMNWSTRWPISTIDVGSNIMQVGKHSVQCKYLRCRWIWYIELTCPGSLPLLQVQERLTLAQERLEQAQEHLANKKWIKYKQHK